MGSLPTITAVTMQTVYRVMPNWMCGWIKNSFFKRWRLGLYLDLQNVTVSKLRQPDVFMSTGVVSNPEAPFGGAALCDAACRTNKRDTVAHVGGDGGVLKKTFWLLTIQTILHGE